MLCLQIGGLYPGSIAALTGGCDSFWEGGSGLCTAMMTLASVRTMFSDDKRGSGARSNTCLAADRIDLSGECAA